jgi:predicted amidophosphoribosyltransferase
MPDPSPVPARVRALLGEVASLLLPVACAGCGEVDVPWCAACARLLAEPPWRCEERAGRFDRIGGSVPVWAVGECSGALRQAVVAWKDGGRADLGPLFAAALRDAAARVAGSLEHRPLVVVAVPSSGPSRRRRGGNLVDALAAGVAQGLRLGGLDARALDALRRRPGPDQVGLGARARARNLAGRVRVRRLAATDIAGERVILVDDVLTTGASFGACREALEAAGASVVAALALASTPRPGERLRGQEAGPSGWTGRSGLRTVATGG